MTDQDFMQEALVEAELAYDEGEYPVGAIIVRKASSLRCPKTISARPMIA